MRFIADDVLDHVRRVSGEPDLEGTRYSMIGPLGRGGMGEVYAVLDRELDREVALKIVAITAEGQTERLRREARFVARLEHPGIVPVHDVGVLADGRGYYVMKLVRGESLDRAIQGKLELRAALRIFVRICEAVAFAHARGVVHRDLKPENVMLGEHGEVLVMDWGIAGELGDEEAIAGTPSFMSPEQARGGALDARSDVYSLGAILRAMIPGDRAVPKPLRSIAEKAMAQEARDRYSSAEGLARDVEQFLDLAPVSAHRETVMERAARFASRHRVLLSLFVVYVIVRTILAFAQR
jgi:serine/threonine protein kinase